MSTSTYLFDLDDTLIDATIYKEIYPYILQLLKQHNIQQKHIEQAAKALNLQKNKWGNYDSGELAKHFNLLKDYYLILETHIKPHHLKHNIKDIFTQCKQHNKKIGIVSNSMKKTITLYLKTYDLLSFVDFIFSQEDAQAKKSSQTYWQALIKKHTLEPKKCVVIGDNLIDDKQVPQTLNFLTQNIENICF